MYKDKHYGLTGQTVKVKHKKGDTDAYPWQGIAVPVSLMGFQMQVLLFALCCDIIS